jgi:hypothetical protein
MSDGGGSIATSAVVLPSEQSDLETLGAGGGMADEVSGGSWHEEKVSGGVALYP